LDEDFHSHSATHADEPSVDHMADPDPIGNAVPTWSDPIYPPDGASPPDELLLMYFEWMGTHKVTDACAKAVYTLLIHG
jgi:hypothetical protein